MRFTETKSEKESVWRKRHHITSGEDPDPVIFGLPNPVIGNGIQPVTTDISFIPVFFLYIFSFFIPS